MTKTLYCTEPRLQNYYEIGRMRIELDFEQGSIRWFNQTRIVNAYSVGMHHPHVFSDGKACEGNAAGVIRDSMSKGEFISAIAIAIAFIESCNVSDSAGCQVNKWPLAHSETQSQISSSINSGAVDNVEHIRQADNREEDGEDREEDEEDGEDWDEYEE